MSSRNEEPSTSDIMAYVHIGAIVVAGAGAATLAMWHQVVAWCLAHSVLLSAQAAPLLQIPNTEGAGIDLPRLAVAVAAVAAAVCLAGWATVRHLKPGQLQ